MKWTSGRDSKAPVIRTHNQHRQQTKGGEVRTITICVAAFAVMSLVAAANISAQIIGPGPQLKIGYINSAEILEKYSCAKDAETKLKGELDKWGLEVRTARLN